VLLVILAAEVLVGLLHPLGILRAWGGDYALYMDATERWLATGEFYQPWQFAPYEVSFVPGDRGTTAILYPPYALALLVPFAFLPDVMWWIVPVAIIAAAMWTLHPTGWRLAAALACLAWPTTFALLANGNPGLWALAFACGAVAWGWPGALVLLKPTLAPFALVGIRRREWWITAGLVGLVSYTLLRETLQYAEVLGNARGVDVLYSLGAFPTMLLPFVAARRSS